jgi:flavin-dependent dehydrogenase
VLGGGPAGSFCAIWLGALVPLAAGGGRARFDITLFDHKSFAQPGPAGCNMCAGVIPDSLVRNMRRFGIELPEHVIQRRIAGYCLVTTGGSVDIPTPAGVEFYSTFRGPGPLGMYPSAQEGFDYFLLREAEKRGVTYRNALVTDVLPPERAHAPYTVVCRDDSRYEADIVVGAFGVNSNLTRVFERLGFSYRAPRVARAFQAEVPLDPEFIANEMRDRVFIFSLGLPHIKFAAITPKREHVTITLVGSDPQRLDLDAFMRSPYVLRRMPPGFEMPCQHCSCAPRLPVTAARSPVGERVVVIGDAHVARYLKNGIESSFHTACWAAHAIAAGDLSAAALSRDYVSRCRYYVVDNGYGRALFKLHDFVSSSAIMTRAHIRVARREQASPRRRKRLSAILWGMFTGNIPYRGIALALADVRLHAAIFVALGSSVIEGLRRRPWEEAQEASSPSRGERLGAGARHGASPSADLSPEGKGVSEAACVVPQMPTVESEGLAAEIPSAAPNDGVAAHPLGPLRPEHTVVIIGGGPAGAGCAIALAREGKRLRRVPRIILVEAKRFGEHQNQCAGVISRSGLDLIENLLGVDIPPNLIQREISGYVLHSANDAITLDGDELGERGAALRRVQLDRLLLEAAQRAGAQVVQARAEDIEVNGDGVIVYTDSGTFHGDVVVGAFGLDPGISRAFARATRYRPPAALETLACKLHPAGLDFIPHLLRDQINVFLPPQPRIEFGALIPKGNHVTLILAGRRLREADMTAFLVRWASRLLPPACDVQGSFKGSFPLGPARCLYGDRYVVLGDASGLVRPFKGKGISAAIEAGWLAARTMLTVGVSRRAFDGFAGARRHLTGDLWYGRLVRWLTGIVSHGGLLTPFLVEARRDASLRQALFDCVSGRTSYRDIVVRRHNVVLVGRMAWKCALHLLLRSVRRRRSDRRGGEEVPEEPAPGL